ncbi:DUF4058 family protein [Aerosakkonema funiforme]|uniref:DUF4058 family protein n=1 Tax=Aerosakkonema funiforme TaxID=1246630 RepID=UPI0035B8AC21
MPNPFPGMNPYLEGPEYWSDFHNQLVAALARGLIPQLIPKHLGLSPMLSIDIFKNYCGVGILPAERDSFVERSNVIH